MAGMMPHVAVPGVDFLVVEGNAAAPVEHVTKAGRVVLPDALNFLTPTGLKFLV